MRGALGPGVLGRGVEKAPEARGRVTAMVEEGSRVIHQEALGQRAGITGARKKLGFQVAQTQVRIPHSVVSVVRTQADPEVMVIAVDRDDRVLEVRGHRDWGYWGHEPA